jgi:hypothetical protein
MATGGLSPQEIEARDREFRSRDLLTKTIRFYSQPPIPAPVATFNPDQNYFLVGADVFFICNSGYLAYLALSYASTVAAFSTAGSSGVSILECPPIWEPRLYWFDPHGFYLEKNRALNVFVMQDARSTSQSFAMGAINLFLLPTWSQ